MGGMLILFSLALATLLLADLSKPYVWLALGVTLAHGLIGFLDDWAKVRKRNSRGLPGRAAARHRAACIGGDRGGADLPLCRSTAGT